MDKTAFITNDAVVFGLLMCILGFVFYTSSGSNRFWVRFYKVVPSLLLCYFLPSVFNSLHIIDGEKSGLYNVISRYLLPASLVLLTLSIDFKELKKLGPKAVIMFLAGSFGVMIGAPLAVWLFHLTAPQVVTGDTWRGLTAIAGSWIGGSANQAAMKELFKVPDALFSAMITIDVIVAYIWMAFLLYGAGKAPAIDRWLKADASDIDELKKRMEAFQQQSARMPQLSDLVLILAVGFGVTGLAHWVADTVAPAIQQQAPQLEKFSLTSPFFWLILVATSIGMILAGTRVKKLEAVGAGKVGTLFLYILIATLGMKMNVLAIFDNPALILVAAVWMLIHILIMLLVARLIKAPFFFVAVGSQANIGGPASAPVVASAFSPALAPVGVLLAVLGYAIGTYGAYFCGLMMQWVLGQ